MSTEADRIAELLGAAHVADLPEAGHGAFGAARLAAIVTALQTRLQPSQGKRPGRPTDPTWEESPKVPMSRETFERLKALAESASTEGRRISPMQLAAQIIEDAVAGISHAGGTH
jgi:hypothetical protein